MPARLISARRADAIQQTLLILKAGGLVAFPTDTVYGLGALVDDEKAVESLYQVKGRGSEKAIPVLIGEIEDLEQVVTDFPPAAQRLAKRFWPGPLTLVLPKQPSLPSAISSLPTVGVRIPDHEWARILLRAAGPMAVTSANLSGRASSCTAEEVMAQLGDRIPLILDDGPTPGGAPSTVIDCTGSEPLLLRAGPLSLEEISRVWAGKL